MSLAINGKIFWREKRSGSCSETVRPPNTCSSISMKCFYWALKWNFPSYKPSLSSLMLRPAVLLCKIWQMTFLVSRKKKIDSRHTFNRVQLTTRNLRASEGSESPLNSKAKNKAKTIMIQGLVNEHPLRFALRNVKVFWNSSSVPCISIPLDQWLLTHVSRCLIIFN